MSAVLKSVDREETVYVQRRRDVPVAAGLPELTRVRLLMAAETLDGEMTQPGIEGTIVGVWGNGEAYDVDVTEPENGLVTVDAANVEPV